MDALDKVVVAVQCAKVRLGNLISIRIGRSMYEELNEDCRRKLGEPDTIFQINEFMGLPVTVVDGEGQGRLLQVVAGIRLDTRTRRGDG